MHGWCFISTENSVERYISKVLVQVLFYMLWFVKNSENSLLLSLDKVVLFNDN